MNMHMLNSAFIGSASPPLPYRSSWYLISALLQWAASRCTIKPGLGRFATSAGLDCIHMRVGLWISLAWDVKRLHDPLTSYVSLLMFTVPYAYDSCTCGISLFTSYELRCTPHAMSLCFDAPMLYLDDGA